MTVPISAVLAALEDAGVGVKTVSGVSSAETLAQLTVRTVQQDSRAVGAGDLFVAWDGAASNAHDFLGAVANQGATAAVVERLVEGTALPQIVVENARLAAAVAAGYVAGAPWPGLSVVGVTGTNGKTTTAWLVRELMGQEKQAAAIGTLGTIGADGQLSGEAGLTTPGPVEVAETISGLVGAGVTQVVLEASSHALEQFRLDGVRFDVAAFSNLTQDHLDYHGTWECYLAAKARLLDLLKVGGTAVVNADDSAWQSLRPWDGPVIRYGWAEAGEAPDLWARNVCLSAEGSRFELHWRGKSAPVRLPLSGGFNVSNALAAAGCALALGRSLEAVASDLGAVRPVPGRVEPVVQDPFDVLLDFAHTPDALEQVLKALRPLVKSRGDESRDGKNRLIVVFGAGGDRDPAKRPQMGAAVARYADLAVVTSDNPRTEDPQKIVSQVRAGMNGADIEMMEIVDRKEAIHQALDAAEPGDMVLLAGKGHERYQVVGIQKQPFDERRIVAEHLRTASLKGRRT